MGRARVRARAPFLCQSQNPRPYRDRVFRRTAYHQRPGHLPVPASPLELARTKLSAPDMDLFSAPSAPHAAFETFCRKLLSKTLVESGEIIAFGDKSFRQKFPTRVFGTDTRSR